MPKKYSTVIFDFDGTVADTAPDIIETVRGTIEHFGSSERSREYIRNSIGGGARKILARCLDESFHARIEDEILPFYNALYNEKCDVLTSLYPGVLQTLKILKEKNYRMALATMKVRQATLKCCKTLGILEYLIA